MEAALKIGMALYVFNRFLERVSEDPTIMVRISSEISQVVGENFGEYVRDEFMPMPAEQKGYTIGTIIGRVILNVVLSVVGPEEVAGRGVIALLQASSMARRARRFLRVLEAILGPLDPADVARLERQLAEGGAPDADVNQASSVNASELTDGPNNRGAQDRLQHDEPVQTQSGDANLADQNVVSERLARPANGPNNERAGIGSHRESQTQLGDDSGSAPTEHPHVDSGAQPDTPGNSQPSNASDASPEVDLTAQNSPVSDGPEANPPTDSTEWGDFEDRYPNIIWRENTPQGAQPRVDRGRPATATEIVELEDTPEVRAVDASLFRVRNLDDAEIASGQSLGDLWDERVSLGDRRGAARSILAAFLEARDSGQSFDQALGAAAGISRELFNRRRRSAFMTAVRGNEEARRRLLSGGWLVPDSPAARLLKAFRVGDDIPASGAPVAISRLEAHFLRLNGFPHARGRVDSHVADAERVSLGVDHISENSQVPFLGIDSSNLRLTPSVENEVFINQAHRTRSDAVRDQIPNASAERSTVRRSNELRRVLRQYMDQYTGVDSASVDIDTFLADIRRIARTYGD